MDFKDFLFEDTSKKVLGKEPMKKFIDYVSDLLELKDLPKIKFLEKSLKNGDQPTFGAYNPDSDLIIISSLDRHPMDVLRTLAHEIIHLKQKEDGEELTGETGCSTENEAHAAAGVILRDFGKKFPEYYDYKSIQPDMVIE